MREFSSFRRLWALVPIAVAVILATGGPLISTHRAAAATFTVTKTADTNDGVCNADCSLREAISAANAAGGADSITVPAGTYTLTIPGAAEDANATGDLDVTQDLTITGAGSASTIIDGGGLDNVIEALNFANLTLHGLTVRNGAGPSGAGVDGEHGDLVLTDVISTGNADVGAGTSTGNVTLTNVTLSNNGDAGLNTSSGNVTIVGSTLSGNAGVGINTLNGNIDITDSSLTGDDSGLNTSAGNVTLLRVTVSGNPSGGINTSAGNVDLTESTVSGSSNGTGINTSAGNITAVNSTIADNDEGLNTSFGTITLTNVTIDNSGSGDGINNSSGSTHMVNTIVSHSDSDDCNLTNAVTGDHNLDSDGTCGLSAAGDISGANPLLGVLANNGGPTKTKALLAGSPAIDAGSNAACPATDQRGVARPVNGTCDIGAVEVGGEASPTSTHTPTATAVSCDGTCTATPTSAVQIRTHTPTPTDTAEPTSTAIPPTSTAAPPTATASRSTSVEGVVRAPNTGTGGGSAGRSRMPLAYAVIAVLGAAAVAGGTLARRRS